MGLDSVELVMEVEKAFNIRIPDREAEKIITVGDFHNCVWRYLEEKQNDKCVSQQLFYKLRRLLADAFQLKKEEIHLNVSPENIFPQEDRRTKYHNFAATNQLQLPDLELTKPWSDFLVVIGIVTILGGLAWSVLMIYFFDCSKWTLLIPVAGIILTSSISRMLDGKRTIIPPQSIREFTQKVLSLNYAALATASGHNRKEVESVINHIIINKVGVEPEEVKPESRLGDDLGVD